MMVSVQVNGKMATARLVSRRLWLEVSAWMSSKSSVGPAWRLERTGCGRRLVTPWVSAAYCISTRGA